MSNGLEGLSANDLIIPEYKLFQNTSKTDGFAEDPLPGSIFDDQSKTVKGKEVRVVLLSQKKSRVLFYDQKNDGKTGLRCASSDALKPNASIEYPVSTSCDSCEFANLDLQYELLGLDVDATLENGAPVVFKAFIKKTSILPLRTFLSQLITRKAALWDYSVKLVGQKSTGKKGSFYVFGWTGVEKVDGDLSDHVKTALELYANQSIATAEADDDEDAPF